MDKYLRQILIRMCKVVGADYNDIDFKKQDWFLQYKWSIKKEAIFRQWFINFLLKNKKARYELLTFKTKDKILVEEAVDAFIFNYGWKYE